MFLWMLFKRFIKWIWLKLNCCPYCHSKFEQAFVWDGEEHCPSTICPDRHYLIKNRMLYTEEDIRADYKVIDMGGAAIPIPEENISYDYKVE
jgi:hypothetical protein